MNVCGDLSCWSLFLCPIPIIIGQFIQKTQTNSSAVTGSAICGLWQELLSVVYGDDLLKSFQSELFLDSVIHIKVQFCGPDF